MKRYYYEDTIIETNYPTLWNGHLSYEGDDIPISLDYYQNSNKELDEIFTEICEVNFYISIIDKKIYVSLCRDSNYYYRQFEKNIKSVINQIESKFNIIITDGEFYANEVKHEGSQYKYTITKLEDKLLLRKKILNWNNIPNMKNLKIN